MDGASAEVMAELEAMISTDELDLPKAATYPLSEVREACRELEKRHTRGKIALVPLTVSAARIDVCGQAHDPLRPDQRDARDGKER